MLIKRINSAYVKLLRRCPQHRSARSIAENMDISGDQKQCWQTVVETLVFVDEKSKVNKYRCINCDQVAIEPKVVNCSHVFCSTCIKDLFGKTCPECGNVKIFEITTDDEFVRGMLDLKVKCRNEQHGCQEIILLRTFSEHDAKCQFSTKSLLPKVYRGQLPSEELKEINDDMQQVKATIEKMSKEIKTDKFSKNQMNSCLNVLSEKVESMSQDVQALKAKLEEVTGQITTTQTLVTDSLDSITVSMQPQIDSKLAELERIIKLQSKEVLLVKKHITGQAYVDLDEVDDQSTVFIWKITGFEVKLQSLKNLTTRHIKSETFRTKEHDLKLRVKLALSKNRNNLHITLLWDPSSPPYWHARQFALLDQSDRLDKKHVGIIDTPLFSKDPASLMMKPYFLDYELAYVHLLERDDTYLRDNAILIKVGIKPLSLMYKAVTSHDGILLWRIDNYASRKRDETQSMPRFLNSEPFYTDPQGYRVLAHLHLDGHHDGKGEYIMLYVGFIIGEFDEALPMPFNYMVKFFLLDQSDSPDKRHISHQFKGTWNEKHTYFGSNFVLQSEAERAPYLKDDTLIFKIMVEII